MSVAAELVGIPDIRRRPGSLRTGLVAVLRRPAWAWGCALLWVASFVVLSPPSGVVHASWAVLAFAMLAGGWVALPSPRLRVCAVLMLVLAAAWSAIQLNAVVAGPWPFLSLAVFTPLGMFLLSVLVLLWPRNRLGTRWEVYWVRIGAVSLFPVYLGIAVTLDPERHGGHPAAWWPAVGSGELHETLVALDGLFSVLANLLLGLLIGLRILRSPRVERQELVPVAVTAVTTVVGSLALSVAQVTGRGHPVLPPSVVAVWNLLLVAVPLSFLASVVVRRVQRALAVERLLTPQRDDDPDGVQRALARALGDQDLQLALWSPARGTFLCADGTPAATQPGRPTVDVVGGDGLALARIAVHPGLVDRTDLIATLAGAASVALDNARLQAEVRAGRREMSQAAARLAEAHDAEERLSRLLPGGVAARLRTDPGALSRTEQMTATVLMSDIRGYSTIAEVSDPAALAAQLNEHRRAMNEAILGAGGTVVQYVGDAVLATFPGELTDHADRALRAAAAMHEAQEGLNGAWAAQGLTPFGLGIGISTGDVAVAFLGSDERAEYTVVGDTVNLTARLTDAARPAGTTIASSATVTAATDAWRLHQLPPFPVKGRAAEVTAYRVATPGTPAL